MMAQQEQENWAQRTLRQAKAEPKKAGFVTLLAVGMVVLWGKVFMGPSAGPTAASAKAPAAVAGVSVRGVGGSTVQSAQTGKLLMEWLRRPMTVGKRNLFQVKLDYFPSDGSRRLDTGEGQKDGFWDQVAKSMAVQADQDKARENLLENLRREASKLDLQSTVISNGVPKALINGKLMGEGETVNGFRIVRIEARRMVIDREGVRLEVLFKN